MPTPFTHLLMTNRLLDDADLPAAQRAFLASHRPDFLLGGIVADQRVPGKGRDWTHFYRYDEAMRHHPWRVMVQRYPALMQPQSPQHRAFMAGYVAHLAADEYWSLNMLHTHFRNGNWGEGHRDRFFVLHLMLIHMDERDEAHLPDDNAAMLRRCVPQGWLPFMPDEYIAQWRDFLAQQINGQSQTLHIFGQRINREPAALRALVDDAAIMQKRLWQHIPPATLATIETQMYAFARQQMRVYLIETQPA